ncbi:class I SAM-dependent methyltransferase [Actinomadura sp. HBU206391]|uniref:class I SAM-dependent methyltransferase n=1 Tax=Actinomadura sp. HBU206391 TaxID=2731692 RepID=UPI00164FDDE1|nr:class I SAM-dependent methyltransferase [Actinomadura sp. HBU206391]MBC6457117.1 class I SAM-dependent methyltransferase [Actinomadura sp. HBU206391]
MTEASYLNTTRTDYDAVAVRYAELFANAHREVPLDRAILTAFAELVRVADVGPVADLGCGPGQVTAYFRDLGVTAFGIDLSPTMIALARQAYPDLRFEEGTMTDLDLADGTAGGILSWYSIIHTPPEQLPLVFAEFDRVLAPGGHILLGFFQADDDAPQPAQAFDHKASAAYRWSLNGVAELARKAGFVEVARMVREPGDTERFRQGRLLARKPSRA